jgi:hypothetical protein
MEPSVTVSFHGKAPSAKSLGFPRPKMPAYTLGQPVPDAGKKREKRHES